MKTSNSQSIDDLLAQAFTDGASDTMWQNDRHIEIFATAKQALYEAVRKSKPLRDMEWEKELYAAGYHQALDDWLTNLAALFGITKEGGDTE